MNYLPLSEHYPEDRYVTTCPDCESPNPDGLPTCGACGEGLPIQLDCNTCDGSGYVNQQEHAPDWNTADPCPDCNAAADTGPEVPASAAMWTGTTTNTKTGDIPTLWVGSTRDESKASCKGCPMLDNGCYAQSGTPAMGHSSMIRAAARGKKYTLRAALGTAKRSAKMARFGAIGDPGALPKSYLDKAINAVRSIGLDVIGYTHHWQTKAHLAGVFMASCDTLAQADEALTKGWRVAVVLPWDHTGRFETPNGAKGIVCPAMAAEEKGRTLTCNDCRLCDGSKPGPVIGFPNHGPQVSHKRRARKPAVKRTTKARSAIEALDI